MIPDHLKEFNRGDLVIKCLSHVSAVSVIMFNCFLTSSTVTIYRHFCCYSVAQLYPTHCDPMDRSASASLEFDQTHDLQAYLGDILSSVPDHHDKVNVTVK